MLRYLGYSTALISICLLFIVVLPLPTTAQSLSLKQAAEQSNLQLGTSASAGNATYIPEYNAFVRDNYNLYVSDWEAHWAIDKNKPFRPSEIEFDFEWLDRAVEISESNNQPIRVHHLVWGNPDTIPDWLENNEYPREELLSILEHHITTVVGRYRGRVDQWSVVNELYGVPWDDSSGFWYKKLGSDTDWIKQAFEWADAADPDAVLILNDAGIEFPNDPYYGPDRYNQIFTLVSELKNNGTPIDGVGLQMHLHAKDFPLDQLEEKMQQLADTITRYRDLGLKVYLTELDIRLDTLEGSTEEKYQHQAELYSAIFETALASGVESITLFGLTDEYSWYKDVYPGADATLFKNFTEQKPAYTSVLAALTPPSIPGDLDTDCVVDLNDYLILKQNFLSTSPSPSSTDLNADGIVDLSDFMILKTNFLRTCE